MVTHKSKKPIRKLWTSSLAGLAAIGTVYIGRRYFQIDIDAGFAEIAILAVVGSVAYLVPPSARDTIQRIDRKLKQKGA